MHPQHALLGAQSGAFSLPVCDHYCGVEPRISKSLALQRQLMAEWGVCPFDVTLDCEDGAPAGGELAHAHMLSALLGQAFGPTQPPGPKPRIAVRVHAVDHPAFASDVAVLVGGHAAHLCHVMLPKVERLADVSLAVAAIDAAGGQPGGAAGAAGLAVHALIESPLAVHYAFDIASHPRVQSLSFGLMDFVSSHGGAIDDAAMGMGMVAGTSAGTSTGTGREGTDGASGQFAHPHVLRAKLEIAAACHAHSKVPSHCVVTEFADLAAIESAARQARQLGYTRMWSIHPAQIRPILKAFAPAAAQVDKAARLLAAAQAAQWAPIRFDDQLHDRASYRYFWALLQRAHGSGAPLPDLAAAWFAAP